LPLKAYKTPPGNMEKIIWKVKDGEVLPKDTSLAEKFKISLIGIKTTLPDGEYLAHTWAEVLDNPKQCLITKTTELKYRVHVLFQETLHEFERDLELMLNEGWELKHTAIATKFGEYGKLLSNYQALMVKTNYIKDLKTYSYQP
jgi:hypothetical protein